MGYTLKKSGMNMVGQSTKTANLENEQICYQNPSRTTTKINHIRMEITEQC